MSELQCCTSTQLSVLKTQVINLERDVQSHKSHATSYDKRRINARLHQLWSAVDAADRRLNLLYFQFQGDPIPPMESVAAKLTKEIIVNVAKPEISLHEKIEDQTLELELRQSGVLRQFQRSVVLVTAPSVHIEDAVECVIYVRSEGPIFVHNMSNCILIAVSHQLRLHNIHSCSVFGDVRSGRVIIEDSDRIEFGGFKEAAMTLEECQFAVDDFNWPTKATASPHYSTVGPDFCWNVPNTAEWGQTVWEQVRGKKWRRDGDTNA